MSQQDENLSIFILKGAQDSLIGAESFLRNRGWQIASSTNLREALAFLIQKQPKFIMITADHSNKKVRVLPKLLIQAFPVKVIAFAEKPHSNSIKALHAMECEYSLAPPVSGPAIDRIVRKMIKDEEIRSQQTSSAGNNTDRERRGTDSSAKDAIMKLSGHNHNSGAFDARTALKNLLGNDGGGSSTVMRDQRLSTYGRGIGQKGHPNYVASGGFKANTKFANLADLMGLESNRKEDESFDDWADRIRDFARKHPDLGIDPDDPNFQTQIQESQASYVPPGGFKKDSAFANMGQMMGEEADQYDDETFEQWSNRMKDFARQNPSLGLNADDPNFADQLAAALTDPDRKKRKGTPGVYIAKGKKFGRGIGYMGQPNYVAPGGFRKGSPFAKLGEKMGEPANIDEDETFEHWAERMRDFARKNPMPEIDPESPDFQNQLKQAQASYDDSSDWDKENKDASGDRGYCPDEQTKSGKDGIDYNPDQKSEKNKSYNPDQQGLAKDGTAYTPNQQSHKKDGYSPDQDPANPDGIAYRPDQLAKREPNVIDKTNKDPLEKRFKTFGGTEKEENLILRGTQVALDESVKINGEKQKKTEISKSSNVACITVDGPKFKGYLVCALGKNRKIDQSLINTIQDKLFSFLKLNGEDVTKEDTMSLKIQEVEFESWAFHQAEFLRKSLHDGEEIAIAFFPTKTLDAELSESASQKMLKLSIDDLKPDKPIEFDLYMFMPENNKYILYTPQGMVIYANQIDRLKLKGVGHMHLRKEAVHDVKKYKAQNFLNDKIASYQNKANQDKSKSASN